MLPLFLDLTIIDRVNTSGALQSASLFCCRLPRSGQSGHMEETWLCYGQYLGVEPGDCRGSLIFCIPLGWFSFLVHGTQLHYRMVAHYHNPESLKIWKKCVPFFHSGWSVYRAGGYVWWLQVFLSLTTPSRLHSVTFPLFYYLHQT